MLTKTSLVFLSLYNFITSKKGERNMFEWIKKSADWRLSAIHFVNSLLLCKEINKLPDFWWKDFILHLHHSALENMKEKNSLENKLSTVCGQNILGQIKKFLWKLISKSDVYIIFLFHFNQTSTETFQYWLKKRVV